MTAYLPDLRTISVIRVIGCLLFYIANLQAFAANELAKDVWSEIESLRRRITSGHLRFEVEVLHSKNRVFVGSKMIVEQWFEQGKMRVDVEEHRPLDPHNATIERFAFDGHRFLVARGRDVAGEELSNPVDDPRTRDDGVVSYLWSDPRIIGFIPSRYNSLRRYGLNDLRAQFLSEHAKVYTANSSLHATIRHPDQEEWHFKLAPEGLPSEVIRKFIGPAGTPVEYRLVTTWPQPSNSSPPDFPLQVEFEAIVSGKLTHREILKFLSAESNIKLDESLFTWARMELPNAYAVVRYENGQKIDVVQWNGTEFVEWDSQPLQLPPPREDNPYLLWILLFNVVFVVCLAGVLYFKRKGGS